MDFADEFLIGAVEFVVRVDLVLGSMINNKKMTRIKNKVKCVPCQRDKDKFLE